MNRAQIISSLFKEGLVNSKDIDFKPLTGGVSSNIFIIDDGSNKYVIKQARQKLKVKDKWYADISRNETEREFISYVKTILPEAVPDVVLHEAKHGFYVMEFLDHSFENWKDQLLKGQFEPDTAIKTAELMAAIHLHSYKNTEAKEKFNTTSNFNSLRIDPYLITTGDRHPELKGLFYDEAQRLENTKEALVHGDFSPKNIMVGSDRIVLLDHEVAWFGDPAFDVAFLLNHFYLKMVFHYKSVNQLPDLSQIFWETYFGKMGNRKKEEMEARTGRLLIMLMLARIDGKSPVEYFNEHQKNFVRTFAYERLPKIDFRQSTINSKWKSKLNNIAVED